MPHRPSDSRKLVAFAFFGLLALAVPSLLQAEDGVIDLGALPKYAREPGQITDTGATLGRLLFYDKRLSRNNAVSCSSCHQQAHAFSTPAIAGTGVAGKRAATRCASLTPALLGHPSRELAPSLVTDVR
jgi:cytochrome c peroxidase